MIRFATTGVGGPPAYVHRTFRRCFDGRAVDPLSLSDG